MMLERSGFASISAKMHRYIDSTFWILPYKFLGCYSGVSFSAR
jgi:hypothetical protein